MYSFDFEKPSTLAEALTALSAEGAQALAGGQTLIPTLRQRLAAPEKLVSLAGLGELKGMSAAGGVLTVGAGTTHAEVARQQDYKALARLAGGIGDVHVRNRGTIGGSLANNDPSADYPAAALGSGATIVTNAREIAADDYFTGLFETALEEGEIITAVKFPIPEAAAYVKFEQPASRFALVGVFVSNGAGGVRVAVTGASEEGVFRWADAEAALASDFSAGALDGLAASADGLIGDIHGSPAYRAHLIGVLARRAVAAAG
jgi:carbon-monoxide dehydrogenase medium subunit